MPKAIPTTKIYFNRFLKLTLSEKYETQKIRVRSISEKSNDQKLSSNIRI